MEPRPRISVGSQHFSSFPTMTSFFSFIVEMYLNCLPNDTIFDWSKLKAFVDNKIKVAYFMERHSCHMLTYFEFSCLNKVDYVIEIRF